MGELILCSRPIAALPYYIENISLNVYSLEEISYYIEHNLYLVETDLMSEELCSWIEKEAGDKALAVKLRDIIQRNDTFANFVGTLLKASGYCSNQAIAHIMDVLKDMQDKSPFECGKIRADRYMENKKYINGILEYRRLLQMRGECKKNPLLEGNILHNMGTAFTRLFLFDEAADCFLEAYEKNQNHESVVSALAACQCAKKTERFQKITEQYGVSKEEIERLTEYWRMVSREEPVVYGEQKIDSIFEQNWSGLEKNEALSELMETWKCEYKKNCRM